MIRLFPSTATTFTTVGLGSLSDAVSCIVTEARNGEFELEMQYPITGIHYSDIYLRAIIVANSNPYSTPQPFRIYDISKPIDGIVTINAQHISYDLSGYPVAPFSATTAKNSLSALGTSSVITCPFTFTTTKETAGDINVVKPTSIRSILGNEVLDVYGGEYEFDIFTVKLHDQRGQNRGVSIRYGKNLTDIRQDENCSSVYTGVYPYWYSESTNDQGVAYGLIQLPEKTINAQGTYDFTKIYPLDLSSTWTTPPTEAQLRTEANNFMRNTGIGVPKISIEVSFIQLSQSEEYKSFSMLEKVSLCDTVSVEFPALKVSAVAKCIKTVYNVLTSRYDSIELGEAKSNIAATISGGFKQIDNKIEEKVSRFTMDVSSIKADLIDVNTLMADKIDADFVEAGYAHLIKGYIDTAQIENESVGNSHIAKLAVGDAQISDLSAGKISSGQLDTSKVDIISPDGRFIIKDNSQLIYDYVDNDLLKPYLRVQVGRLLDIVDGELVPRTGDNNYGFEVRDANGETVMIDGSGVHSEGITEGAVNNSHISPNAAIDGAKLDIATVVTAINGGATTIEGSKIYVDNTTLDVKISSIHTEVTEVKSNIVYKLEIISSNGQVFKNGDINTTLEARVYHGIEDVTDQFDSSKFRWTRISNDTEDDTRWNNKYFGGTKNVTVSNLDVQVRATFSCRLLDNNLQ